MGKCLPLELTKKIIRKHSESWKHIQEYRDLKGKVPEIDWDDKCYFPIYGGVAIACEGDMNPEEHQIEGAIIAAIAAWRLNKKVYSFDKLIEEALLVQEDDEMKVSLDRLSHLPDFCIYIKTEERLFLDGFFVYFDAGKKNRPLELILVLISDDRKKATPVHMSIIPGKTIKECVKNTFHQMPSPLSIGKDKDEITNMVISGFYSELMPYIMYICNKNENSEKPIEKRQDSVKDTDDEVQYIHYGQDNGDIIKKMYDL